MKLETYFDFKQFSSSGTLLKQWSDLTASSYADYM